MFWLSFRLFRCFSASLRHFARTTSRKFQNICVKLIENVEACPAHFPTRVALQLAFKTHRGQLDFIARRCVSQCSAIEINLLIIDWKVSYWFLHQKYNVRQIWNTCTLLSWKIGGEHFSLSNNLDRVAKLTMDQQWSHVHSWFKRFLMLKKIKWSFRMKTSCWKAWNSAEMNPNGGRFSISTMFNLFCNINRKEVLIISLLFSFFRGNFLQ